MKYWILTTEYPPLFGGGIGTYCFHTAQMLSERGYQVTIFISSRNQKEDAINIDGNIRIIEFALTRTKADSYLGHETFVAYEFAAVIEEYLNNEGIPDVIESQEYNGIAYYILQKKHLGYAPFSNIKLVLTLHAPSFLYHTYNEVPEYRHPYFWIGEMERWCIQAADLLNAPSHFLPKAISPFFLKGINKEIKVIPYPYSNKKEKKPLKESTLKQWFFFGKLTPQKGIIQLLKSYKKICQNNFSPNLMIIGGDHYYHPEQTSMKSWIRKTYKAEIKAGKITLHGNLSPLKLSQLFTSGSIIIIPSIGDNYPFTVIESMQKGLIVLVSKQGGQSELVVHGKNGFVFDHSIENDLEDKLLLINSLSLEQCCEIRANAIATVEEKHNYEFVYKKKSDFLSELHKLSLVTHAFPVTRPIKSSLGIETQPVNKDLLSVVIPYYNMGNYINETIESVFNSTYPMLEVIIINDGSTEEHSISILEELKTKHPVSVYHFSNNGLSATRNTGAAIAKGEFLAFVDADDKVNPEYFTEAIEVLKKKDVTFVGSWVQYFEGSNNIWPAFTPAPPYIYCYNMVCSGALVYKKDGFLRYGQNDSKLKHGLEDWDSVISLVKNGQQGVVIPKPMYFYRIREKSMMRKLTNEKIIAATTFIAKKNQLAYADYASELSALYNSNGPAFLVNNITQDLYSHNFLPKWIPYRIKIISQLKKSPILKRIAIFLHSLIKNK